MPGSRATGAERREGKDRCGVEIGGKIFSSIIAENVQNLRRRKTRFWPSEKRQERRKEKSGFTAKRVRIEVNQVVGNVDRGSSMVRTQNTKHTVLKKPSGGGETRRDAGRCGSSLVKRPASGRKNRNRSRHGRATRVLHIVLGEADRQEQGRAKGLKCLQGSCELASKFGSEK